MTLRSNMVTKADLRSFERLAKARRAAMDRELSHLADEAAYRAAEFIEQRGKRLLDKRVLGEDERALLAAAILKIMKGES